MSETLTVKPPLDTLTKEDKVAILHGILLRAVEANVVKDFYYPRTLGSVSKKSLRKMPVEEIDDLLRINGYE